MCSSNSWCITDNNVTKRMIDNSLTHTFLSSQKIRKRTKIFNTLLKNRKVKDYKQYVKLKTSILRNIEENTETDYDTGLTDADCSFIYSSPSKQTEYVAENFEKYILLSEDECTDSKKKKTKTAANIKIKLQEKQIKKKKVMVSEAQNEKSVPCHNRDSNVTIDKALPQNVTYSNRTSVDNNVIENYEINFINNIEDFEIDENIEDKLNCDQLFLYTTKSQHNTSLIETAFDNMLLDQQNNSVHENLQDKLNTIEEFSNSNIKSPSHLDIMQEMLNCPEELKEIAEAIILNDFKEVTEDTCYNDITNPDTNKEAKFSKELNFLQLDQVDKDVSVNQEETIYSTQEVNSCNIKEQTLLSPEQSLVKDKHSKVCKNLNNIFEEQDKRETSLLSLSNQKIKNFPCLNQIDENVDVNLISQNEIQLIKAEESPHKKSPAKVKHSELYSNNLEEKDNKQEKKSSIGKEDEQNSSLEQNNMVSISMNQEDVIHSSQTPDLYDIQIQEISSSKQSGNDVHSKVYDNISQDEDDRQMQVFSNQEDSYNLSTSDKDTESDTINQENTIHCMKIERFSDARPTIEQSLKKDVLSPKQNPRQDAYSCIDISEEQNNEKVKEFVEKENEEELINYSINNKDKTPVTKSQVTCNTAKEQLSLRVTSSKILNTKYRIIDKRVDDICGNVDKIDNVNSVINKYSPIKDNILINSTNVSDYNSDKNTTSESNYEKNNECYISSRAKKRREEQARLNLVVYSDSSESDDKTEHINFNNFNTKQCNNINKNKQTKCIETETLPLRISESNVFYNSEEHVNKSFIDNRSLLNKENVCDKSNHCKNRKSIDAETRKFKSHEENIEISTNRPYNLQELVESQKLVAKTMPPTLTLADISDEEEAYILNVPSKLLECNLTNQLLTLKENTIKFGKNKYRIVDKQVNTISWVFATGKKQKPYRIVNLNNVSTITILDNDSHYSETASRDVVTSSKTDISKEQRKKPKMSKLLKHNNRKRNSSDFG